MTPPIVGLLVATSNRNKLAELRSLLADLPIEIVPLAAALPDAPPVIEDGATFEANALLKARAAASAAMMVTLAEDSGLEVDALDGRPGVRSARFVREGATDAENNAALLAALEEVPDDQRAARFRCVMVVIDPWAEGDLREVITEGRCEGAIARSPRGDGGFGYDPLFVVRGYDRTMAELTEGEKNVTSHRGRAVEAVRPALRELCARHAAVAARAAGR